MTSDTAFTDSTSPYDGLLGERGADVGRLVVHELAERVLRVPRDSQGCLVARHPRPIVRRVIAELSG